MAIILLVLLIFTIACVLYLIIKEHLPLSKNNNFTMSDLDHDYMIKFANGDIGHVVKLYSGEKFILVSTTHGGNIYPLNEWDNKTLNNKKISNLDINEVHGLYTDQKFILDSSLKARTLIWKRTDYNLSNIPLHELEREIEKRTEDAIERIINNDKKN